MTTSMTQARFLELANRFAVVAEEADNNRQLLQQRNAACMAAIEDLADKKIALHAAAAALANCEMEVLILHKQIRQQKPIHEQLERALAKATARFRAACKRGGERVLQAGRNYAVAAEQHAASHVALCELERRAQTLVDECADRRRQVEGLKNLAWQAEEEFGMASLSESELRDATANQLPLKRAEFQALEAAVALFGTRANRPLDPAA